MENKNITMKQILRHIFLLIAVCASMNSWAVSNADVTVHVIGDSNCGKVGVNSSNTVSWETNLIQKGGFFDVSKSFTFYFFAQASTGYAFKGWYSDEDCTQSISSSANYSESLKGGGSGTNYYDRYGKFVRVYNSSLTIVSTAGGTATVNGSSSYASITNNESPNHSYTLSATPSEGKVFVGWYSDADHEHLISNASTYTYSLTAAHLADNVHIVYAYFADKLKPSIKCGTNAMKVDESKVIFSFANVSNAVPAAASDGANFYYTITNNTPAGAQCHPDHPSEIIVYDAASNTIKGYNAGTATITFVQNATDRYEEAVKSFDITVSRHANTISLQGYTGYTLTTTYGKQFPIVSTNDATRPGFTVTPLSGGEYATFHENNGSPYIQSNFKDGTAVLKVSQAEDYKYSAAEANLVITVAQAAPTVAYVYYDEDGGSSALVNYTSSSMALSGPADKLYFDAEIPSASISPHIKAQYSVDGSNWTQIADVTKSGSYGPYDLSNTGAKYIRFVMSGSLSKTFKNIKVTRKIYLNASASRLDFNVYEGEKAQQTFTMDWSIGNGGEIKVRSDHPDFTVSPAGFGNGDNADGTTTVTVSYKEAEGSPNTAIGHIYVYNDVNSLAIPVSGVTKWKADSGKRYSLQSGGDNVTVTGEGATELMNPKSHLLQAFAFGEQGANTYSVKYDDSAGSEQTLYSSVTTIKENGKWKATVDGTVVGDIVEAGKYDCTLSIKAEAQWGTFIAPYKVQMPSGVTAYACKSVEAGSIVVTEHTGNELEANVPYIIKSENSVSQTYSNYGCAAQDDYSSDFLTGTYVDYETVPGDYVLQKHESGTGFFIVIDVRPMVKPSRCYIPASSTQESRAYIIRTDGTSAIEAIEAAGAKAAGTLHTIDGIKVTATNPAPGIYIRNGKKFVVR